MDDKNGGSIGTWGILIVLFLLFIVFGGGFGALGNRGAVAAVATDDWNRGCGRGCNGISNCEVERQEIIDTYNTQLNTINQGNITRTEMAAGFKALADQSRAQFDAQQGEKIFDLKMENQALKQTAIIGAEFCALNRRMDEFAIRPPFYARGYVPDGQCVPLNCGNSCGIA